MKEAIECCPAHGHVLKGMILLTCKKKPLLRAGKGTVQRRSTVEMYKDEIDALYVLEQVVSRGLPLVSVNLKSEIRYIPHSTDTFRKDWSPRN